MPEEVGGEIRIKIEAEGGEAGPAGAGAPGVGQTPGQKRVDSETKKSSGALQTLAGFGKKMLPFAGLAGIVGVIIGLIRRSATFMAAIGGIMDILGAFIDVLLAPLMPLIGEVFKLIAPFIPVIQKAANALIGPVISFLTAILDPLIEMLPVITEALEGVFESLGSTIGDILSDAGSLIGLIYLFLFSLAS